MSAQLLYEVKRRNVIFDIPSQSYIKYFDSKENLLQEWVAVQECAGAGVQKSLELNIAESWIRFEYDAQGFSLLKFDSTKQRLFLKQLPKIIKVINHCHKCGWIHGDIKPSNIIYSPDNDSIRVIDFGSSQRIGVRRISLESWQCTTGFASTAQKKGVGSYQETDDWVALIKIINQFLESNPVWYLKIRAKIYKMWIMNKISN